MPITRKQIADDFDAIDDQIADLNDHKRELLVSYRAELAARMGKDEIKAEVEAVKAAIKRRRAVKEKGAEVVEYKDALTDEVFEEITLRAPRATRVASAVPPYDPETGEIIEPQQASAAVQTEAAKAGSAPLPVESGAVAISTPIQPETANEPHITAGHVAPETGVAGHHPASRGPGEENGAPIESPATILNTLGDAGFRDPLDWEDEDGAQPAPTAAKADILGAFERSLEQVA
jgi:hypothetical protein